MTTATADNYFELVRRFPLRPIRSRKQYAAAAAVLDELAVRDENGLAAGERDYLAVLADLIEAYDERHHQLALSRKSPAQVLRYLMKEAGMRPADLARVIGSRTAASLVLNGKRQLSKGHIISLSKYFRVEPGLFLAA
jgi:HTH-type transcriptional regulator/antitoxin HigA